MTNISVLWFAKYFIVAGLFFSLAACDNSNPPNSTTGDALASLELSDVQINDTSDVSSAIALVSDPGASSGLTFSIVSGADKNSFILNQSAVELYFVLQNGGRPVDDDNDNTYDLVVSVSDGESSRQFAISVVVIAAPNTPPVFSISADPGIAENSTNVGVLAATDADGDVLSFSLVGGADQGKFSIQQSTGQLTFVTAPDYEAPGDTNSDNIYEVTVELSDGEDSIQRTFMISVSNVNDVPPSFSSSNVVSVTENTTVVTTLSASTTSGNTLAYSIAGGNDQGLFSINGVSGALTFQSAPDFEAPADANTDNSYDVVIAASDGVLSTSHVLTVSVTNVSDIAPVISSAATASVPENSTAVIDVNATDSEGDAVTYSISGGVDEALFSIDSASGVLSFSTAPDFETPADSNADNRYEVVVTATDGVNGTNQNLSVQLTNVNEAPWFTSAASVNLAENQVAVYTVAATDPDGDALTFSITGGADLAAFTLNASSGALVINSAPDYEAPADANADRQYDIVVTIDDGNGATTAQNVAVTVTDVSQISIDVSYPTNNSNLGAQLAQSAVTGNLYDAEDGVVEIDDLNYIDINGVLATQDPGNPGRWSAQVPVPQKSNVLSITSESTSGSSDSVSLTVINDDVFGAPSDLALDVANNRYLVLYKGALVSIDLSSGARTIISNGSVGTGIVFTIAKAVALDAANNRVLITDWGLEALISVDLSTGDRTVISDASTGSGKTFSVIQGVTLDAANNRALVGDFGTVFAIDLNSGNRTVISGNDIGATIGSGTTFFIASDIVIDPVNNRLYIANVLDSIISVDLTTGNRTILSDASTGSGIAFSSLNGIALDSVNTRLLVTDLGHDAVLAINMANGDRAKILDGSGSGVIFSSPARIVMDVANNRALVVDTVTNDIVAMDLSSGARTELWEINTASGSGVDFAFPDGAVLDSANNRLLVTDDGINALVAVDLSTGNRTVISDAVTGTGTVFSIPRGLVLDSANNRVFVVERGLKKILAVDLTSGNRSIISDSATGTGTNFNNISGIALDSANNRLLVNDGNLSALFAVDIASGNRTILSDPSIGTGPTLNLGRNMVLDAGNNRALILLATGIVVVDLTSGNRSMLSTSGTGSGDNFISLSGITVDLANNRALVVEGTGGNVISVDLANGNRTPVSIGGVTNATYGSGLVLDSANNRLFLSNNSHNAMMIVELGSGERSVMSQ